MDNGTIQHYLTETEMCEMRPGYREGPRLPCFKKPQSDTAKTHLKNSKLPNKDQLRRTRITEDEWERLRIFRGEEPRKYDDVYRGKIPKEKRMIANALLEERLARKAKGVFGRTRRSATSIVPKPEQNDGKSSAADGDGSGDQASIG
jgi:hypothetical protein